MPFIFIDRIIELERHSRIKAFRNFSTGEEVFRDHFPGYPTVPGSLLLEALTQTASALIEVSQEFQKKSLPILVERVKYRRRVKPGDRLSMEGEVLEWSEQTVRTDMIGRVDGDLVIHAEITFGLKPIEAVYPDSTMREIVKAVYRSLLDGAEVRGFAERMVFLK